MLEATRFVERIQSTNTKADKIAIIREAAVDGCSDLFVGLRISHDRTRVLGIKKAPDIEGNFSDAELEEDPGGFDFLKFQDFVKNLEQKKYTPDRANEYLRKICEIVCIKDWKLFYRPVLLKKFRIGLTEREINSTLAEFGSEAKQYHIPIWKMQKSSPASKHRNQLTGTFYLEPKLDEQRCIIVMNKQYVNAFDEKGNPMPVHTDLVPGLHELSLMFPIPVVWDCVLINAPQHLVISKHRDLDPHIAVTDLLALEDFNQGYSNMTQEQRHNGLAELSDVFREHTDRRVYVLPKLKCDVVAERNKVEEFYAELQQAGIEWMIAKSATSVWEGKKSNKWLEWKL